MRKVIFVAPFFGEATLRFIRALVEVEGARVALITQEPEKHLPAAIRERLAAHYKVVDGTNPDHVEAAARKLAAHLGGVDRLFATGLRGAAPAVRGYWLATAEQAAGQGERRAP